MPYMVMAHETDPKDILKDAVGDLEDVEIFNNQVLAAIYVRPTKTKSGIFLTDNTVSEDRIQGKVGLVIKMGPKAFIDSTGEWFDASMDVDVGDWIVFRPSDGWSITVNDVLCRVIDDTNVRGRIQHPDAVW